MEEVSNAFSEAKATILGLSGQCADDLTAIHKKIEDLVRVKEFTEVGSLSSEAIRLSKENEGNISEMTMWDTFRKK